MCHLCGILFGNADVIVRISRSAKLQLGVSYLS